MGVKRLISPNTSLFVQKLVHDIDREFTNGLQYLSFVREIVTRGSPMQVQ